VLALRVECSLEQVGIVDARDLDGILEAKKYSLAGAFFGFEFE
jgi:hypothetical protein